MPNFGSILLTNSFLLFFSAPAWGVEINLLRPTEKEIMPHNGEGSIVAGHVKSTETQKLWINGQVVDVYKTGSFMTYLNASKTRAGNSFTIEIASEPKAQVLIKKTVRVETPPALTLKDTILASLKPRPVPLIEILSGEILPISFKATPKAVAGFKIGPLTGKIPLRETQSGFYEGQFMPAPAASMKKSREGRLILYFKPSQEKNLTINTGLTIRVASPQAWPRALIVTASQGRILALPQPGSYWITVPSATVLTANGIYGNLYRVRLARALSGWISNQEARLAEYTPEPGIIDTIETNALPDPAQEGRALETQAWINWDDERRLPFKIEEESPRQILVRIFNAKIHLNRISYSETQRSSIEHIDWTIAQEDEIGLRVHLKENHLWGFWTQSVPGGLILRLPEITVPAATLNKKTQNKRALGSAADGPAAGGHAAHAQDRAPHAQGAEASGFGLKKDSPYLQRLAGLRVMLDPGHGAEESGAPSPSGMSEAQINLRLAQSVAAALKAQGAQIFMTRQDDKTTVSLLERTEMAKKSGAHIFLSLHCNDLSTWLNPLTQKRPLGYSFYYYRLPSWQLAQHLEKTFTETPLGNIPNNGVYWADLYVLREITIPAVLIESGYAVLPWQEEQLAFSPEFAQNYAQAIVRALEAYIVSPSLQSQANSDR